MTHITVLVEWWSGDRRAALRGVRIPAQLQAERVAQAGAAGCRDVHGARVAVEIDCVATV